MQSPGRKRPLRRARAEVVPGTDLDALASRATYVGSPEHKSSPSFAGHPKPRSTAAICDPSLAKSQGLITEWVREAIRRGNVGAHWEGDFPRYVWHEVDGVYYEGRLVNREQGQYKGYPLYPHERPEGLEGA